MRGSSREARRSPNQRPSAAGTLLVGCSSWGRLRDKYERNCRPAAMPACCCTVACPAAAARPPPLLLRAAVRARGLSASGSWLKRPIRPLVPACCW